MASNSSSTSHIADTLEPALQMETLHLGYKRKGKRCPTAAPSPKCLHAGKAKLSLSILMFNQLNTIHQPAYTTSEKRYGRVWAEEQQQQEEDMGKVVGFQLSDTHGPLKALADECLRRCCSVTTGT